jgi:hypothetical protein
MFSHPEKLKIFGDKGRKEEEEEK